MTTSIVAAILIMGIAIYAFVLKSNEVVLSEVRDIDLSLSNTALTIDKRLSQVEASVVSNIWQIDKCVSLGMPDSVGEVLSQLIALHHEITGCGVIFGIDKGQAAEQEYMIYASRDSSAMRMRLPSMVLDKRNMAYAWLRTPLESGEGGWSAPHADLAHGRSQVCTYIVAVGNRRDQSHVLLFADVSVETLTDIITADMPKFLVEAFLIDSDGRVISFIEKSQAEKAQKSTLDDNGVRQALAAVGDSIQEGDHGAFDFDINGHRYPAYFDVINSSNWILYYVVEMSAFTTSLLKSSRTLIVIFLLSLASLYVVISLVIKRMTKPLRQFSDAAIEISKGKFNEPLPIVDTHDEMARLHDSFATMQHSLNDYMRRIEESSFLMGELRIASRIQDDLLPKDFPPFPERDDINVHASLTAATQIGGDLYNYFIRDSKLFFIVGDVSGKSVPAAMVMAIACTVFKTVASIVSDPVQITRELNAITCSNNEHSNFFVTALVGVLDLRTGKLNLCNAGHDPMVILTPDGKAETIRLAPNLPAGVKPDFEYKGAEIQLQPKSRIVAYTDGITESENSVHGFYGLTRLKDLVSKNADQPLTALVDMVVHDVQKFSDNAELADDLTLMVIDYTPSDTPLPPLLTIGNESGDIERAMCFADEIAANLKLNESQSMKVHLVIEEAITNVINHSSTKSKKPTINLFASVHDDALNVIISDDGRKFDPTAVPVANIKAPLHERPVGGLGLTLIRSIASRIAYRRLNGRNYFTISFDLKCLH